MSGPTKGDSGTAHFTTSNLIVQKPYDFMESQNQATELAKSLNRFWDIESEDEQFLRFIKFDKDGGRYEVDLPWREQTCKQSDNFHLSVTRLDCLKAHLKKDKKLLQEYDTIFRAQLKAGIKELVPRDEEDLEGAHFPPHHGVLSEDRETKKLRIVFDGSERADNPVLLPSRYRYTELLIRQRHDHVHHNGVKETLNAIRETHWVLKGREGVKRVIRKCTICRRYEGKPFTAPPPLPPSPLP